MKKGTTLKLAALLLGAALILPACTGMNNAGKSSEEQSGTPQSSSQIDDTQYTVAISNKAALQEEWPVNGGNRKIDISVDPVANIAQLISEGKLTITSSDTAVLTIAGQMATPVAPGRSTITIKAGESTDSVEVTIAEAITNKSIYGTVHEGTADDPFDNEDAIKAAKKNVEEKLGGVFYIKGKVASFYHAPGSRTDGMVSWFLEPAQEGGEKFEVYKCLGADGKTPLTDDDIWVGGEATAYGSFAVYNNQYETSSATFVSCEGNKPAPRTTVEVTFAKALEDVKALADGADTYDYYKFDAYVTKKDGSNYFLTATKGEEITDVKENTIELYNVQDADAVAKLMKNAKVTVTMILKNYHEQVENLLAVAADQIVVVEAGEEWVKPQGEKVTVAEARAKIAAVDISGVTENNKTLYVEDEKLFEVTGYVTKKGTYSDSFGNGDFYIADTKGDAENTLQVFRLKDKDLFDSLTVDETKVAVTCKLAAFVKLQDGAPYLAAYETNANPDVVVVDDGEGGGGGELPVATSLELSAASLSLNTTSYAANNGEHSVDNVKFTTNAIMKRNKEGATSMQWQKANASILNTTALPKPIENIVVTYETMGYSDNNVTFEFGNASGAATDTKTLVTVKDTLEYTITPSANTYDFVKISNPTGGAHYIESVVINYVGEGGQQQEVAQPAGTFSGKITGADDAQLFCVMAIANEFMYFEAGSLTKEQIPFNFDKVTGKLTLTSAVLGPISAVYDEASNKLTQITLENETAAAMIKNNGTYEFAVAGTTYDCEGTTDELNAIFGQRQRDGSGWKAALGDISASTDVYAVGKGAVMSPGSTSFNAVGLTLRADLGAATGSNIGFWVYNPSESDVKLQSYYYKSASYGGYQDFYPVAKASSWTYFRIGQPGLFNFNLADFTKSGVNFVFDDICLY